MSNLDRTIHEPARLRILSILSGVGVADFNFICGTLGLTKGNLSSHMDKLEKAGFVEVKKSFNGKTPHTDFKITPAGREALDQYWKDIEAIRALQEQQPPPPEEEKGDA